MSTGVSTTALVGFHEFWSWLAHHFNCIVEAGGPDFTLFDMPDVHWHLEACADEEEVFLVQLYRAKVLCGEMVLRADGMVGVAIPLDAAADDAPVRFECIVETPDGPAPAYHFVMAHGMDARERWTH